MTPPTEITVTGIRYWADKPQQLAQLLGMTSAPVIRDPSGHPSDQMRLLLLPFQGSGLRILGS
jgi:hypothetical protein